MAVNLSPSSFNLQLKTCSIFLSPFLLCFLLHGNYFICSWAISKFNGFLSSVQSVKSLFFILGNCSSPVKFSQQILLLRDYRFSVQRCTDVRKNGASKPKYVSRPLSIELFQFVDNCSQYFLTTFHRSVRRLAIPRGVKLSFNPENEFLFMIQAGHDMPAFSFIFIAVRSCNRYRLLSAFIAQMSGRVGYFFPLH